VYLWYTNKKEKKTFPVLCIAYYGSEWVQPCPVGHGRTTCQIIGWLVYVWCRRWPEIERGILRRGSAGRRGIQRASSGAVGRHSALAPGGRRNDRRIGEALLFSFTGDPLDSNNEREGIEKRGRQRGRSRCCPALSHTALRRRRFAASSCSAASSSSCDGDGSVKPPIARPSCGVSCHMITSQPLPWLRSPFVAGRPSPLAAREIKRPAAVYALEIRRASTPIPWVGQCGTGRTHGLTPRAM
jgi:hypothetical protein